MVNKAFLTLWRPSNWLLGSQSREAQRRKKREREVEQSNWLQNAFASERQEKKWREENFNRSSVCLLPSRWSNVAQPSKTSWRRRRRRRRRKKESSSPFTRSSNGWSVRTWRKLFDENEKGLYSIISMALFKPINSWSIRRMHQESLSRQRK